MVILAEHLLTRRVVVGGYLPGLRNKIQEEVLVAQLPMLLSRLAAGDLTDVVFVHGDDFLGEGSENLATEHLEEEARVVAGVCDVRAKASRGARVPKEESDDSLL